MSILAEIPPCPFRQLSVGSDDVFPIFKIADRMRGDRVMEQDPVKTRMVFNV